MRRLSHAAAAALASLATLALSAPARAAPCTVATVGLPCAVTPETPCSGICLLDVEALPRAPICVIADAATLALVGIESLDGLPCSPDGGLGRDCAHACHGLEGCVPAYAAAGAGCLARDDQPSTCGAACDGDGACVERGDAGSSCTPAYAATHCSIDVCDPFASAGACWHFDLPSWAVCEDATGAPATCGADGACVAAPSDAGAEAAPDAAPAPVEAEGTSGCTLARPHFAASPLGALATFAFALALARRRGVHASRA